jgi:thioredoxin-related protein
MRVGILRIVCFAFILIAFSFSACKAKDEEKQNKDVGKDTSAVTADGKPKIVAVEAEFDFGKVKQGAAVEHVFKIRNEGNAPLKIEKARGS